MTASCIHPRLFITIAASRAVSLSPYMSLTPNGAPRNALRDTFAHPDPERGGQGDVKAGVVPFIMPVAAIVQDTFASPDPESGGQGDVKAGVVPVMKPLAAIVPLIISKVCETPTDG
jgi:hypothetical protein